MYTSILGRAAHAITLPRQRVDYCLMSTYTRCGYSTYLDTVALKFVVF